MIQVKRIYEKLSDEDGMRVLVDRLWPRGLSKSKAMVDRWMKEVALSNELRKWFSHDADKWDDFKKLYFEELNQKEEYVQKLLETAKETDMTLLYAARDVNFNNAVALKEYLESRLTKNK